MDILLDDRVTLPVYLLVDRGFTVITSWLGVTVVVVVVPGTATGGGRGAGTTTVPGGAGGEGA
jgi:hypothetical protein